MPWLFTKHTKPEPFVGQDPTPAGSREAPSSLSCISLYTSAHKQHSLESVVARGALFNEIAARVQPLRTLSAPGALPSRFTRVSPPLRGPELCPGQTHPFPFSLATYITFTHLRKNGLQGDQDSLSLVQPACLKRVTLSLRPLPHSPVHGQFIGMDPPMVPSWYPLSVENSALPWVGPLRVRTGCRASR